MTKRQLPEVQGPLVWGEEGEGEDGQEHGPIQEGAERVQRVGEHNVQYLTILF